MDFQRLSRPAGLRCFAPTGVCQSIRLAIELEQERRLNSLGFVIFMKSLVELIVCVGDANPLGKTPRGKGLSFCVFTPELELAGSSLEGCLGEGVP